MNGRTQRYAIVGMKHCSAEDFVKTLPPDEPVTLIREPDNQYDSNAVQVWARGRRIGYVPKSQNAVLAKFIDATGEMTALMGMDEGGGNVDRATGKSINARFAPKGNYPLVEL